MVLASKLLYILSDLRSIGKGVGLFGGLFYISSASITFKFYFCAVSAVALLLTAFYPTKLSYFRERAREIDK